MRTSLGAIVLVGAAIAASPACAADPVGSAVAVVQQASVELDGTSATLADGDGVFIGQRVVTTGIGQVQIVFSDDTHVVVGPGSTLLIEEYLMRNSGTASKFVIDALGGSFRFITGDSPKNAYAINTPTGTMGVRGTEFDLSVAPVDGETHVLLYHGGVVLCDNAAACVELTEACDIGVISKNDSAAVLGENDVAPLKVPGAFPYVTSQARLRTDFRVKNPAKCLEVDESAASAQTAGVLPEEPSSEEPPPSTGGSHNNNGGGNGGEGDEGDQETGNPGKGNGNGAK